MGIGIYIYIYIGVGIGIDVGMYRCMYRCIDINKVEKQLNSICHLAIEPSTKYLLHIKLILFIYTYILIITSNFNVLSILKIKLYI